VSITGKTRRFAKKKVKKHHCVRRNVTIAMGMEIAFIDGRTNGVDKRVNQTIFYPVQKFVQTFWPPSEPLDWKIL
jgi:hypothetical protein